MSEGGDANRTAERASLAVALHAVAGGDRVAFASLYHVSSAKLFGVCLRILRDRQEAEDALQEAYVTVWRRASAFDESRGAAMTWLAVLTRNVAIDRLRARRGTPLPLDVAVAVVDPSPLAVQRLLDAEEQHRLAQCLGELDPGDAVFIRTAFFEGSTYAELATRSAQPLGTVKSRIRRALLRLKACLQ